jgi:pyrroloquinoline quinone (PQQ) biosynthesis protein C
MEATYTNVEPPLSYSLESSTQFARLDRSLQLAWEAMFSTSRFVERIRADRFDARLYGIYMIETYHYTSHNARNQALAGARSFDRSPQYLKFCFEHAEEETGHELMALHDLCSLGLDRSALVLPAPLPATEVLIAYLYWVSQNGNTVQRLGYSYWAENSYGQIDSLLQIVRRKIDLKDSQLTFFVAHSTIDDKHAREVHETIEHHCRSGEDWEAVERVMLTSLALTGRMLEDVDTAYEALLSGADSPYAFLNALVT